MKIKRSKSLILLSDPIVCGKELLYLCQDDEIIRICASVPENRSMDVLFLECGRTILARGRVETAVICEEGDVQKRIRIFRILERKLVI